MIAQQNVVEAAISDTKPGADLTALVADLLAKVHSLSIRLRQNTGAEQGKLASAEHAVLEILDLHGTLTVPQIARERATSRQNIQILVDRLKADGQVEMVPNPAHKRSLLVQLTGKGKQLLEKLGLSQKHVLAKLASRFSEVEVSGTVEVLSRIQGLLSGENQGGNVRRILPRPRKASAVMRVTEHHSTAEEFPVNLL